MFAYSAPDSDPTQPLLDIDAAAALADDDTTAPPYTAPIPPEGAVVSYASPSWGPSTGTVVYNQGGAGILHPRVGLAVLVQDHHPQGAREYWPVAGLAWDGQPTPSLTLVWGGLSTPSIPCADCPSPVPCAGQGRCALDVPALLPLARRVVRLHSQRRPLAGSPRLRLAAALALPAAFPRPPRPAPAQTTRESLLARAAALGLDADELQARLEADGGAPLEAADALLQRLENERNTTDIIARPPATDTPEPASLTTECGCPLCQREALVSEGGFCDHCRRCNCDLEQARCQLIRRSPVGIHYGNPPSFGASMSACEEGIEEPTQETAPTPIPSAIDQDVLDATLATAATKATATQPSLSDFKAGLDHLHSAGAYLDRSDPDDMARYHLGQASLAFLSAEAAGLHPNNCTLWRKSRDEVERRYIARAGR